MSTFFDTRETCYVCRKTGTYRTIGSTNAFGPSDLDLRPPEMQRSTMSAWVHECPGCGYAASDVSDQTGVTEDFLASAEYRTCSGLRFLSGLAARFYKQHMILLRDGDREGALWATLHAAWASDDARDRENAAACRREALRILEGLLENPSPQHDTQLLMKADLLRRSGQFSAVVREFGGLSFSDGLSEKIRAFQVEKARAEDDGCYPVRDADRADGRPSP